MSVLPAGSLCDGCKRPSPGYMVHPRCRDCHQHTCSRCTAKGSEQFTKPMTVLCKACGAKEQAA